MIGGGVKESMTMSLHQAKKVLGR
ncbi:hypothetical protein Goshw_016624 [Gossypium schwendimanii]|uniref:Uncharacterized protein n=1 Tax=Gossypium schwendimanii TaxID=34291 RepID=A0A7J9LWI1_GOSSC|nr:hypothetical protein [Gossypium schwendimanii]